MIYLLALFLLSCSTEPACHHVDDFVDKWWQVNIASNPIGNCYLFTPTGEVVEKNSEITWVSGAWEYEEFEDCSFEVSSSGKTILVSDYKEECWQVQYQDKDFIACECQL